jgi:hypothetical protein
MPMIKIDGQDYDYDSLPETAKKQLQCLQFVDAELLRLDQQAAVFKTARIGYYNALKQALNLQPAPAPALAQSILDSGTIKFS